MSNVTFTAPDLDAFCQLDKMGLQATGQRVTASHSVVEAVTVTPDR
jgi:hypothetical protein